MRQHPGPVCVPACARVCCAACVQCLQLCVLLWCKNVKVQQCHVSHTGTHYPSPLPLALPSVVAWVVAVFSMQLVQLRSALECLLLFLAFRPGVMSVVVGFVALEGGGNSSSSSVEQAQSLSAGAQWAAGYATTCALLLWMPPRVCGWQLRLMVLSSVCECTCLRCGWPCAWGLLRCV